ncbi:MAG: membrane protein insertase YidC [Desulfovibrio sp.]
MDNKRVLLAVALSFLVLMGFQYFFPAQQPAPQPAQTEQVASGQAVAPLPASNADPVNTEFILPAQGETITIETPLYTAAVNSSGGILDSFLLKKYFDTIEPDSPMVDIVGQGAASKAPLGLIFNGLPTWSKGAWETSATGHINVNEEYTLTLTAYVSGYRIARHLTFYPDTYYIAENVEVTNTGSVASLGRLTFTGAANKFVKEESRYNMTRIDYLLGDERTEVDDEDDLAAGIQTAGQFKWGAINSNYFLFALMPMSEEATLKARIQDDIFRIAFEETRTFDPGKTVEFNAGYYLGPSDRELLSQAPEELGLVTNFGWFDFLAKFLLVGLDWCYDNVYQNYGVAILLLTILIKLALWPLSQISYKSMKQMQRLQPHLAQLKEKYGDDKERMQKEMMQLYKTYKVNPASGCLPIFIQLPVFFGFYRALFGAVELRHASFIEHLPFTDIIWLADLSAKDPFYVTPIIMGGLMFLQQKLSPQAGDPMQQKIMLFMPLMMTVVFLNFPSGLVLYWLMNSIVSIIQQVSVLKSK